MNNGYVYLGLFFLVVILSGCGTTSNDLKMKIIEAQMAQNAQIHQINTMPKYEIRNCTGDCQFTVFKEQDELIAFNPVGLIETSGMDVLKIGIQELGATARQASPYAAGAYAINKFSKALSSSSTHNGDVIHGNKAGNDNIANSSIGGDSSLVGTTGDGLMQGTDMGNVDSTHDPVIVTNEVIQVVEQDKVQVVEVDKIQVVDPVIVKPEVVQIPTEVITIEKPVIPTL